MTIYPSQRVLCGTVLLLLANGCGESLDAPAPSDQTASHSTAPANEAVAIHELEPPADKSLLLNEYLEAGVPAYNRIWSGDDMLTAVTVLAAVAQEDPAHLPRYQSERSGMFFDRMTSDENLDLFRNQSVPIQQRLPLATNYMEANNELLKVYLMSFIDGAMGGVELLEIIGAQLRVWVVMNDLVNEFVPTLDKSDPTYPVRMEGLEQMKLGMALTVTGTLQTLTDGHAYRTSDLKRFTRYMTATFPHILRDLPEANQTETLIRLRTLVDEPKMQHLKPELDDLLAIVEKAVGGDTGNQSR
ncbi:MAG: hypothetical protein KDA88_12885 [Planctomycetaceae bacterium]|nr:hypothetical protein [Planctomycetaceae bacterium]MCB9951797.1 hypothetical protein [Planctomycetaceae bacterium]